MREFIDKTSGQDGTDINRAALMAIQGFETRSTVFNADGSFTETNALGQTLTTVINPDGSITQTFEGAKTITRTYTLTSNGWEVNIS